MTEFLEEKYQLNKKTNSIKTKKKSFTKNKLRIAILGGSTTNLIKNSLSEYLKINNIEGDFFESDYNQFYFESINPSQRLKKFNPQIIYIHSTTCNIEEFPPIGSENREVEKLINQLINKYQSAWNNLTK